MEHEEEVHNEDNGIDGLECPSSEELLSEMSSDDEVGYRFPQFMADTDMRDPKFQVSQLFSSIQEFRKALQAYGAINGYNVKCKVNDERRVQGICKDGCKWRIWASTVNNSETVQVKSYTPQDTCFRDQYNRHCNYKFIVNRYIDQFKADPEWKTKNMQAIVKSDLKINITRNVAWKFVSIRSYATEVLRTNPGSTVIDELLPEAEHRFCVRHMYTNFFNKGFKGKTLKDLLWRAAKATTVADYRQWMQQIRQVSEDAHKWLIERHPTEWSKSHFRTNSKSDILLNSVCEVFNKMLIDDRENLIATMLTDMQLGFMTRIENRRSKMRRYKGELCPRIKKKLDKITEMSNECTLHFSGGPQWKVDCRSGTYVVDLEQRSCACRKWDLTGIPCCHAVAVIRECRNEPTDKDTSPIKPPSWIAPQRGRKQKKRRMQADENVIEHSQGTSQVRRKGKVSMTCSICGLQGHNKRYHSSRNAPHDDWYEGKSEPVEARIDAMEDRRIHGKLIPDRRVSNGALNQQLEGVQGGSINIDDRPA